MSHTSRLILALLALTSVAAHPRRPSPDGDWWIVVGSSPDPNVEGRNRAAADRGAAAAKRCGVLAEPDFSGKWTGLTPGFYVQVAGGYPSRAAAERDLRRVRRCVPDAYLYRGRYAGE